MAYFQSAMNGPIMVAKLTSEMRDLPSVKVDILGADFGSDGRIWVGGWRCRGEEVLDVWICLEGEKRIYSQ